MRLSLTLIVIINEQTNSQRGNTGHKIYIDSNGDSWEPTTLTNDTCGTTDNIVTIDNNGIIWDVIS